VFRVAVLFEPRSPPTSLRATACARPLPGRGRFQRTLPVSDRRGQATAGPRVPSPAPAPVRPGSSVVGAQLAPQRALTAALLVVPQTHSRFRAIRVSSLYPSPFPVANGPSVPCINLVEGPRSVQRAIPRGTQAFSPLISGRASVSFAPSESVPQCSQAVSPAGRRGLTGCHYPGGAQLSLASAQQPPRARATRGIQRAPIIRTSKHQRTPTNSHKRFRAPWDYQRC
jgi:hypothetical protein